jgi:hypothetical protein
MTQIEMILFVSLMFLRSNFANVHEPLLTLASFTTKVKIEISIDVISSLKFDGKQG